MVVVLFVCVVVLLFVLVVFPCCLMGSFVLVVFGTNYLVSGLSFWDVFLLKSFLIAQQLSRRSKRECTEIGFLVRLFPEP